MPEEPKLKDLNMELADNRFTFICPECGCSRPMNKANIGQDVECECCLEMVKVNYPENRPCPKCNQDIKLKAKVCKHCKQRIMPFVDPFTSEVSERMQPAPIAKRSDQVKTVLLVLGGTAGGFAIGLFGTRAIADLSHRHISGHADIIVGGIMALFFAFQAYRSRIK